MIPVRTSPIAAGASRSTGRLPGGGSRGRAVPVHAVRRAMLSGDGQEQPPDEQFGTGRTLRMARLEAILFVAREPLTTRKLSQFANLADGTEARTLIRRLNEWYDARGFAFRIERTAGGYRMMTRAQLANWVRRLEHVPEETRLSTPAIETLALVAYRQPIMRADIEAIRGVSCGEVLRQLMERDLVRICGRGEELGRPYLYGTTKQFLLLFGLKDLADLPRAESLRGEGMPRPEAPTETVSSTVDSSSIDSPETGLRKEKEPVTATATLAPAAEEELERLPLGDQADAPVVSIDDDDEEELDSDFGEDDDEDDVDDYDDDVDEDDDEEDDDFDDYDDEDDDEEDDVDDLDDEDDFDDWEEVDDDEEEDDLEDEDDDEWDDDDEEDDEEWDDFGDEEEEEVL